MNLAEGERTNFVHDIRTFELAFINGTDPTHEHVVAVPKAVLLQGIEKPTPKTIETAELPFKFQFHGYQKNSVIRAAQRNEKNLATTGLGLRWIPEERTASAGTDNDSRVDQPAAYLTILSKSDNTPIGTYLVSYLLAMNDKTDRFDVEGKSYRVELRPKRYYKPFQFELKDVRKEDYLGTSTPRFYELSSSFKLAP